MIDGRDVAAMKEQNRKINDGEIYQNVAKIIRDNHSEKSRSIFILNETPDQLEDIYVAIIDGKYVFTIDILRSDGSYKIKMESLEEHKKTHNYSKSFNRKISAIEKISKEIRG